MSWPCIKATTTTFPFSPSYNGEGTSLTIRLFLFIHHFYIDHNAPCLPFPPPPPPPRLFHIHCFQFLLGITVIPREIEDNGYASFGRVRQGALRPMWKWWVYLYLYSLFFSHFLLTLWSNATILSRKCYRDFGETNNNLSCIIKHWGVFY